MTRSAALRDVAPMALVLVERFKGSAAHLLNSSTPQRFHRDKSGTTNTPLQPL